MCYFQDFRCRSRKGFEANSLPTCIAGSSSQAFCNLFLRNNDPKTSNVGGAHDNLQSSKQDQSSKGKRWKTIHQNHVARIVTPGVLVMFKDTPKPLPGSLSLLSIQGITDCGTAAVNNPAEIKQLGTCHGWEIVLEDMNFKGVLCEQSEKIGASD